MLFTKCQICKKAEGVFGYHPISGPPRTGLPTTVGVPRVGNDGQNSFSAFSKKGVSFIVALIPGLEHEKHTNDVFVNMIEHMEIDMPPVAINAPEST